MSYIDYSSYFSYKQPLTYQMMNQLGENDRAMVNGEVTFNGLTLSNNFYVDGVETITGTLNCSGLLTASNGITMSAGSLGVIGNEVVTGKLDLGGALNTNGAVNIQGNTAITGNLTVGGDFTASGILGKVGSFVCPASTGNYGVTGLGFQPRIVRFQVAGTSDNTTTSFVGRGVMDYSGNQWAIASIAIESGGSATTQTSARCLLLTNETPSYFLSAAYVSMDADGFTLNFYNVSTSYTIFWEAVR